jgi:hypothetical protein
LHFSQGQQHTRDPSRIQNAAKEKGPPSDASYCKQEDKQPSLQRRAWGALYFSQEIRATSCRPNYKLKAVQTRPTPLRPVRGQRHPKSPKSHRASSFLNLGGGRGSLSDTLGRAGILLKHWKRRGEMGARVIKQAQNAP